MSTRAEDERRLDPATPHSWVPGDRRRRIPIELPMTLGTALEGPRQVGAAVNVSAGGMFVQSAALYPVGTPLWVSFALPLGAGPRPLDAAAWVRWINSPLTPKAVALPPGMGIQFLGLDSGARTDLEAFLTERLGSGGAVALPGQTIGYPWSPSEPAASDPRAALVVPAGLLEAEPTTPAVLLIGFQQAEAARLITVLAQVGHRAYPARDAREAAVILERHAIGLALADLEGSFKDVLEAIEAVRVRGRARVPLLGVGSVAAGAAMTDVLRALGLEGLARTGITPQELVFRVNAVLYADRQISGLVSRRVPVDLPARFQGIDGPVGGRVLNISTTGLFLAAEHLLPTNRQVAVTFALDPGAEPITLVCRVVWANAGGDGQRYFQGMGLQFLEMKPAARSALHMFLADALADLGASEAKRGERRRTDG